MSKALNRAEFGKHAAYYINSPTHARGASLQRLVDLTAPKSDWYVLDVATAVGHTALAFAVHVEHVTAVDLTREMITLAQKETQRLELTNVTLEVADAEKLPYDDGRFHLVTCRIAPHHFEDIPRFVREATRVLRPEGLLAVVDNIVPGGVVGKYVNSFEKKRDPSHGRCLTLEEWVDIYESAGLEITSLETLGKELVFEAWAGRHPQPLQDELRRMLQDAPAEVREFLQPQFGERTTFRLLEGIIVGRKPG